MKRIFTLSTALKLVVLLALWGCASNKAHAQVAASCNSTGESYTWQDLQYDGGASDITINGVNMSFVNIGNTHTFTPSGDEFPTIDSTSVRSFPMVAGTSVTVTANMDYESFFGMYVDWNKDGQFDSSEYISTAEFNNSACCTNPYVFNGTINVPAYLISGQYRARFMMGEYYQTGSTPNLPGAGNACADWEAVYNTYGGYPYGEVASIDVTFQVTNNVSCFPPHPPIAGTLTSSSAVALWALPPIPANSYDWQLLPGGAIFGTTPLNSGNVSNNTITLGSLFSSTTYDFYVRSNCGGSTSTWQGPLTFTTLAPQCTSTPNDPSIITALQPNGTCLNQKLTVTASNVNSAVSGISYQWQYTTDTVNGVWNSVIGGTGAQTLSYTTPAITTGPIYYRLNAACFYNGINYTADPTYAYPVTVLKDTIPYFENFSTTPSNALPSCYEANSDPLGSFSVQQGYTAADGTAIPAMVAPYGNANGTRKNAAFTLPPLLLNAGSTYTIQFNYSRSNTNYAQRLQLYANTTDPGTTDAPGIGSITTNGIKLFDTSYTFNNIAFASTTFSPPASGFYYFSWFDSSQEASFISQGTAQGISNIAIYIAQPCVQPTAQATALAFTSTVSSITGTFTPPTPVTDKYLVVRTLGTTPLTGFTPVSGAYYTLNETVGNGTVIYEGKNPTFTDKFLSAGASYTYTIFAYNDLCSGGPLYAPGSLAGTYQTSSSSNTYVWNQSVAGDYQVATNWTPSRLNPDPSDILVFSNSVSDTVNNVNTAQSIGQLNVINNTVVHMRASTSGSSTLSLVATTAITNVLIINANASLILDGTTNPLTLAFGGAGATATINGNLEVQNNSANNVLNFNNCMATVSLTGTLAAGGTSGSATAPAIINTSTTNLQMNGTYNHKYTSVAGGNIPIASWNTGSTVLISGYTTATAGPGNLNNQTFYNFTYNCPNQTTAVNLGGIANNTTVSIPGTFTMTSTGTGSLQLSAATYYIYNVNNYVQTGGKLDLASGNGATIYTQNFNVAGTFNQTGGTITETGTGTTSPIINFNGANGQQNVNFYNAAPVGQIVYRISNYNGINLTGTGTLTTNFNINSGGGMRISTTAPNPLTTSLTMKYAATGSTLTFDSTASYTATANVWPATNGPYNVTVFVGQSNAVSVPFDRTIGGVLTFTSGDLDMSSNNLTLGTATGTSTAGSIAGTNGAGYVRLTTGSFKRWFPTTTLLSGDGSLGTTTGNGYFPIAYGPSNRTAYVFFTTASALSTGGTITITHTNLPGLVPTGGITDGAYSIQQRTASSWTFTAGNGITLNSAQTMGVRIVAANLFNPVAPANLRLLKSTGVIGTYVAGGGTTPNVYAERTGLALTDLTTNSWYIGAATADIGGIWTAITTGNWSANATWDQNVQPPANAICVINPNVTVTQDANSNVIKVLTNNGTLNVAANTLIIDSALSNSGTINATGTGTIQVNGNSTPANMAIGVTNNGIFNVAGGTVTVGPSGGGNKPFIDNNTLTVSSGTLNINGNFLVNGNYPTSTTPNAIFAQSGGVVNVDGNAAGVSGSSVNSSTAIVAFHSPKLNLTGGTLAIIDPHVSSTPNTFEYGTSATNAPFYNYNTPVPASNPASAHTISFGSTSIASSTGGGNSTYGFKVNVAANGTGGGRFNFGNVLVAGGATTGTNRFVGLGISSGTSTNPTGILGNLTINNHGEFRANTTTSYSSATGALALKGNLTVNAGGVFTCSYLLLTDYSGGTNATAMPSSPTQTISGGGTFRNSTSTSTTSTSYANFGYIYLCGGSNPTFMNTFSFYPTLNFSNTLVYPASGGSLLSHIFLPNNNRIIENAGASNNCAANTGWVVGAYEKNFYTGNGTNTFNGIGDSLYYTPVGIGATVTTQGNIYVSTTHGLEPNIATSTLNPLKTLQRYYTVGIPAGDPIRISPNTLTVVNPQWVAADLPVGANPNLFYVALDSITSGTNTPTGDWSYPTVTVRQPTQITANGMAPNLTGNYTAGEKCPPTTIDRDLATNIAVCSGFPDTLSIVATGLGLTYQWFLNGAAIPDATGESYVIPNPQQSDSGAYYVVVNGLCAAPMTSGVGNVTIINAPSFAIQPAGNSVCIGGADTLMGSATGTAPLSYQWLKNGVAIPGANDTAYIIPVASLGDAAGYTLAVTNACATLNSTQATVVVNPLPVATITALGSTTVCAGSSVVFEAPAGNTKYVWTLNGAPSGSNSRYDTITAAGGLQVTVTSAGGCIATSDVDSVKLIAAPPAMITTTSPTTFCLPGSVVLYSDTSISYTYKWLKNGAPIGATGPYYTANSSGNYQVVVTNSYNCPDTSAVQIVVADPVPVPIVTSSGDTTFCQGSNIVLSTSPSYGTYNWIDLNTNTSVSTTSTSGPITSSGSYEVLVTDLSGCNGTSSPVLVTVHPAPVATATAQGPADICPGNSVVLAGGSGTDTHVKYQWYNNTLILNGSTAPTYTATNSGNYSIRVTDTTTGCYTNSAPVSVLVDIPFAIITPGGNQSLCQGNTLTLTANPGASYQWYNGSTPLTAAQTLNVTSAGVYTVAVTNTSGCTATSQPKTITMVPKPVAIATAGGPTTFCAGGEVTLSADTGTGLTYLWTPGGATTRVIEATTTGAYTVTTTNTSGCSTVSNVVNVDAVPYPVATISSGGLPTSICTGQSVLLTAGPVGNTYLWSLNGVPLPFSDPNRTSISYPATTSGTYSVTVTNSTGCASTTSGTASVDVFINPVPTIQALGPTTFCWGSSDVLSVNPGTGSGLAYQWFQNGIAIPNATGSTLTLFDSGYYSIVVNVVGSCSQTSDSVQVKVIQLPAPVITGSVNNNTITSSGSYQHYQWYFGNTPLEGDTLSTVTVYQDGDYHLVVTNGDGCNGVSNVYHKGGTSGVGVVVSKDDVNIYPNPVTSIVHIDASVAVDVTVGTVDGRAIMQQADAKTMDLTGLANGIYMIRVYDKSGTLLKVAKLVKASND